MSKKGNEHKSPADALAAILGSAAFGATKANADDGDGAEPMDDLGADADEPPLEVVTDTDAATGTDTASGTEKSPPRSRRERSRTARILAARRGRLGRVLGLLCLGGGVVLTVLDSQGRVTPALAAWGCNTSVLMAIGSIAYVLGAMQRQTALAQLRSDSTSSEQQGTQSEMQANLTYLVEQQQQHALRPPAQGEELEQVLVALQRQDEKVNNLSRALKMYGKPMSEIANQGADVAAQVSQLKGQVDALQQGFARLDTTSRGKAIDLGPLERQGAETAQDLRRTLTAFGERLPDKGALQQQLVRVEAGIQAVSQRLEDSEVRKSLLRLEEVGKHHGKKLDELAPVATLQEETRKLERLLDTSVGKVSHSLEQLRSKDVAGLDGTVREIQREVSGLATAIAFVQQALKNNQRAAPAAAAPAPAQPTAAAAAPVTASEPPSPPPSGVAVVAAAIARDAATAATAAARPAAPVDTAGLNDAQAGVAQNRTGSRAAASKNVLGAIAKLKKMKG